MKTRFVKFAKVNEVPILDSKNIRDQIEREK